MKAVFVLLKTDIKRRSRDGFILGYNIIFPVVMILLLGYLSSGSYGRAFTGYQYYSVVMPSFCIAMAMITAAYAGKEEAYQNTAVRFLFSPISKTQIVLSKLFSCCFLLCLCNLTVILFAKFLLKLPLGREFLPVFLLLASETFAVCAIGLFIGLGMKNFMLIKNALNIPICLAAIFGGAFYPIGSLNPKVEFLLKLSPLTWINRGIFLCLYDKNPSVLWRVTLLSAVCGIGFTILTVILFKKEEYIHGDLPGFEK